MNKRGSPAGSRGDLKTSLNEGRKIDKRYNFFTKRLAIAGEREEGAPRRSKTREVLHQYSGRPGCRAGLAGIAAKRKSGKLLPECSPTPTDLIKKR